MHEFELGVWKALFIHLLRMLNAVDKSLVDELDRRYVDLLCYLRITSASHLWHWKLQAGSNFWQGHDQTVCEQCVRAKKASGTRLCGFVAGMCRTYF
jgi:hypothetical protein